MHFRLASAASVANLSALKFYYADIYLHQVLSTEFVSDKVKMINNHVLQMLYTNRIFQDNGDTTHCIVFEGVINAITYIESLSLQVKIPN